MIHETETIIMGRIREEIDVEGRKCWTLFDSGARNSYITRDAALGLQVNRLADPTATRLGGATHTIEDVCIVQARLNGRPLHFQAGVLDEIGHDEAGREIDILLGAIAMQLWGIRLDPQNESIDLSHFTTEFLEF